MDQYCLDQIASHEEIGAWSFVDQERALQKADALDWMRQDGSAFGPLHGCPVGLRTFEVKGMPHGCGSPLMGEVSQSNAVLVDALEAAGAVVVGKTETTEFAALHPSRTKNPTPWSTHQVDHHQARRLPSPQVMFR